MAASLYAKVPPAGETIGLGRKEAIYASDVQPDGVPVGNLDTFNSFTAFTDPTLVPFKYIFGVFRNLQGGNSFLPTGYKFGAYRLRADTNSYDDDPCLLANAAFWAQVRMLRRMVYLVVKQDQTPYITMKLSDALSWASNERLSVANGSFDDDPLILPSSGTDHEGRALDVNNQPWVLAALETWHVEVNCPQARSGTDNFSPVIPIVETVTFDGVLIRPTP